LRGAGRAALQQTVQLIRTKRAQLTSVIKQTLREFIKTPEQKQRPLLAGADPEKIRGMSFALEGVCQVATKRANQSQFNETASLSSPIAYRWHASTLGFFSRSLGTLRCPSSKGVIEGANLRISE
jgi:hypothetical protein